MCECVYLYILGEREERERERERERGVRSRPYNFCYNSYLCDTQLRFFLTLEVLLTRKVVFQSIWVR
jgi:hypothetical protein